MLDDATNTSPSQMGSPVVPGPRLRDIEAEEYGPVVLGPGPSPEDGSCGQFAVAFHTTTSTVAELTRLADVRGVSVPELCRQVIGVFIDQQRGDLGALLAAEGAAARIAELDRGVGPLPPHAEFSD